MIRLICAVIRSLLSSVQSDRVMAVLFFACFSAVANSESATGFRVMNAQVADVEKPALPSYISEGGIVEQDQSEKSGLLVSSAKHALVVSADRASALGYDLDKHLVRMTQKEEGGWEVYFAPRKEKKGQRGGGLTVHVDHAGDISNVQRWR